MSDTERPNILWLLTDHHAYYRHGWDGGVGPRMPNYERICQEGIQFEKAYCATPLCGPDRRTLLTGLYAHHHGQIHNETDAPYDHPVYLDVLAEAGYQNYYFGKWHAGPGNALDHHCQGFSHTGYGNPYITETYRDYLKRYQLPAARHRIERVFEVDTIAGQFPALKVGNDAYQSQFRWCGEHAVGLTLTPKETHESFFLANLACETLDKIAAKGRSQPFHLRVDFWGPHQPFFPTREFADLYRPEDIPVYGSFNDDLSQKPAYYQRERNAPLSVNNQIILPSVLPWSEWQKILARCYAQITMIDAAAGLILKKLDDLGLSEKTLVLWASDHGDALASHGGRFDKTSIMIEEVMRTLLAMRWPGQMPEGRVVGAPVNHVDIAPTIVSAAGAAFPEAVDGQDLLPLAMGQRDHRDGVLVSETFGHGYGDIVDARMITDGRFKLVAIRGQLNELYDLNTDPYELENLIAHPDYQDVLSQLTKDLLRWQKESGDSVSVWD